MLKLLRLLRLSRMARMARLLRSMPELLILIKGMVKAMRSVGFTLLLLALIVYVFAIFFKQMSEGTVLREKYFPSVPVAFHRLMLYGVLLDSVGLMSTDISEKVDNPIVLFSAFLLFIMISALTVMNMLIGVLCEVIAAVAEVETEEININYMHDSLLEIVDNVEGELPRDEDDNIMISKDVFNDIIQKPQAAQLLEEMQVDCLGLVDLIDMLFVTDDGSEKSLTFTQLLAVMLDHRSTSDAAVKDVTDMRKFVKARFDTMVDAVNEVKKKSKDKALKLEADLTIIGEILEKHPSGGFSAGYFKEQWQKEEKELMAQLKLSANKGGEIKDVSEQETGSSEKPKGKTNKRGSVLEGEVADPDESGSPSVKKEKKKKKEASKSKENSSKEGETEE